MPSPADLLIHAVEHVRDGVLLVLQQVDLAARARGALSEQNSADRNHLGNLCQLFSPLLMSCPVLVGKNTENVG